MALHDDSVRSGPRPLDGLIVLDFTWVVAGPTATRMLSDMGASVYRIEWPFNLDLTRNKLIPLTERTPEELYESSGMFNDLNAGKKSITLNMKDERGRELFRRMLLKADIVTENFSPSAMEKWGFDYDAMKAINPRIIYMSLSGYGHTGRSRYYLTYGPSAQALNGLTFSSGLPGEEPAGWGFSYMDQTGGYVGALALLMAIYKREKTGKGQYLDLSQAEAGMALTGAALLDYTVNGRKSRRPGFPPGNRATWPGVPVTSSYRGDPTVAPHNSYRTAGGDYNDWCVICCFDDSQFGALTEVMGQPELAGDPRFATLGARLDNQEALDAIIGGWTALNDKYDIMERLQAVGVPAGASQSAEDRLERDPQLQARQMLVERDHPVLGRHLFQRMPVHMSLTPPETLRGAPLIGIDNEKLLFELIGSAPEEVQRLVDAGVLWPEDLPRPYWIRGAEPAEPAAQAPELVPGQ